MKLFFLCLCLLSTSCSAGYADWLQEIFLGRSYQAKTAYQKQDYDTALADLELCMDSDPYNPECNYNVGTVLYKQQKYSDAQEAFLRVIEDQHVVDQLKKQAYFNLGNCYYQQKLWQQRFQKLSICRLS